MTPEEIVMAIVKDLFDDYHQFHYDNVSPEAINHIKEYARQYGREMCDKQIEICIKTFGDTTSDADVDCLTYKTDYPKELE